MHRATYRQCRYRGGFSLRAGAGPSHDPLRDRVRAPIHQRDPAAGIGERGQQWIASAQRRSGTTFGGLARHGRSESVQAVQGTAVGAGEELMRAFGRLPYPRRVGRPVQPPQQLRQQL